ncbi:MAG: TAXI family TRAP transporter solute-binding subunit [Candidatus Thiodiazotropha sp. (ex Lucinoma aequizonata)]|nr:TAXI family TRAP transporter solute-binding subunit [Candidatus Thiodiazotropha sp. (ex Lucinoma aequizonata)]MCU7888227.1 TAXI family TRAP transporter solute-binding subunit [Candidatus Thiodiazotropha sp. (ex Lucinoma aequizonata)]MCU7896407.1 TAXI family TRAP transporter solute-binding subunit [Candidatus Thiodiazotropha sp. (ex Lucinoma aequizonata)]MCU7897284.1 TAXI family TRAP transporter solute-binding subunit [Candidatus Thiodiazotropha sp. (ex Lucinoma aequizonata)]MCU7901417.1 TAXI
MLIKRRSILAGSIAALTLLLALPGAANSAKRLVFSGGPAGGTFQVVANAVQVFGPVKKSKDFKLKAQSSAGSVENLRKVNKGRADFGVVYSGHVYLGREGKLKNDTKKYEDVLAVAYLYGAPAQLITKKGSGIKSVKDLKGKKVGVGNAGSGAFANCELFFSHMGIWENVERNAMGYNDAAAAFGNNQLDAFWLFTAFPSGAVIMAAQTNDIELVNVGKDAEESGFFEQYPYFTKLAIPAGTYKGVEEESPSFQDSALWVANAKVSDDDVYNLLSMIYTEEGLAHMVVQKKTFKEMAIETGLNGVVTPMHPGAQKFWKEKGLL